MKTNTGTNTQFNHVYYRYKKESVNGEVVDRHNPSGFLFDENFNLTEIKSTDLPKSFIYGVYEYGYGYLDSSAVKGLKYIHSMLGDFMENDLLLVSYSSEHPNPNDYDCLVKGGESLNFLRGVNRNSDLDVFPIYSQLCKYRAEYARNHPDDPSASYDLHIFIFGFPARYRKDERYKGNEKMMRYAYETELMKRDEIAFHKKQLREWERTQF